MGAITQYLEIKDVKAVEHENYYTKKILIMDLMFFVHIKFVKSTRVLWKKLKKLFDGSDMMRCISLLRTLISERLENCVTYHGTQIIETNHNIKQSGFNFNKK